MEMPIQVFITMFIMVVVGSLVIMFSQGLIDRGNTNIDRINPSDKPEDTIFDVKVITVSQIANLVDSCYRKNFAKSLGDARCFIIHGETSVSIKKADVLAKLPDANMLWSVDENASKTFYVDWFSRQSKVVVKT